MDPSEIPIRDIHLPEAIGYWPMANGLAGLLLLISVALLIGVFVHFYRKGRFRRAAFRELRRLESGYKQHENVSELVRGLSILLRRAALLRNSRKQLAWLHGEQWLVFLDGEHPERPFSQGVGKILQDGPYQRDPGRLDSGDYERLLDACRLRLSGLLS